jgi:putative transposase
MTPPANTERYKNHRFPSERIWHGGWPYYCFLLSYRDVQAMLLERGIDVTYEAIRQWCLKFGQDDAKRLRRRRAQPGDKWHLDEVSLTIHSQRHSWWRAVDQNDTVLDILVQSRRKKQQEATRGMEFVSWPTKPGVS